MTGRDWAEPSGPGDSTCLAATRGLCNACGVACEAQVRIEGERVVLVKWCPDHGESRGLVSSDPEWYLRSLSYVKPGTHPAGRAIGRSGGCPGSCGLCPEHQQHTCVPLLEITDRCNLACPICLVAGRAGGELSLAEVESILDRLVAYEGRINMLTLSGGEPTVHPGFVPILDACRRREIGIVSVSTNGVALDRQPDLIRQIRDREAVISLQLDGFTEQTYRTLRGRPELAALKRRVIERCLELDARLSLTMTLARGVNEHEMAAVLELLFSHDQVLSVMVQPLCRVGAPTDTLDALTIPDAVRQIAAASGGVVSASDFTPLPCSHPSCFALTYLLKLADGRLVPISSLVEPGPYLDIIQNQALLGTDLDSLSRIRDAVYGLWSADGVFPHREPVLLRVRQILRELSAMGPEADHRTLVSLATANVKSIFIHHFMDRSTFDLSRAVKCCNHYPRPDGRLLPACVRNNLGAAAC